MMGESSRYADAVYRGFGFARDLGSQCGPVHFLVGIAECDGPLRSVLTGRAGQSLRAVIAANPGLFGQGATYLHMQAQGAARAFAATRSEPVDIGHLLVALLDQAEPQLVEAMRLADIDRDAARSAALRTVGAPPDQPRIALPALTAAGTLDRPPMPLSDLPAEAWTVLQARQSRLPLSRLHRTSDWFAILSNESLALTRLAKRLNLDDDEAFSLRHHHHEAVTRLAHEAAPTIVAMPRDPATRLGVQTRIITGRPPWRFRHPHLAGWGCWFGNRRVEIRAAWLRIAARY